MSFLEKKLAESISDYTFGLTVKPKVLANRKEGEIEGEFKFAEDILRAKAIIEKFNVHRQGIRGNDAFDIELKIVQTFKINHKKYMYIKAQINDFVNGIGKIIQNFREFKEEDA